VEFVGMTQTLDLLGAVVFAVIALVIMLRINALITLIVFVPLSGVVVAAQVASTRIKRYRQANRETTGRVTGLLGEMFGSVQAVHAANAVRPVIVHFQALNEQRRRAMVHNQVFTEVLNSIFFNAVNLGTGLILLLAGQAIHAGTFTVGDFALFVFFLTWVSQLTKRFGTALAQYKQIGISLDRMTTLLQGASAQALVEHSPLYLSGQLPTLPLRIKTEVDRLETLSVTGLTYHYPTSGRGINAVHLVLPRGTFTVITGRVGSGKTCLLRVLLGLLPKEAGEIRWNGQAIADPASFFVPPRSAYTPQVPRLFSISLRDNVLMGLPEDSVDMLAAIHAAVLEPDVAGMEQGLDTLVGRKGVRLSGGQIQRTAAARMFVRQPELLVVDDLSSALDIETEHLLWQRVLQKGETTCLAVSHRRAALSRADHIVVIKEGHIEAEGTLQMLLRECKEMQLLWDEQN
jgi:ATP-binding cassette subfamily B protein